MAHFSQIKFVTVLLLIVGVVGNLNFTVEDDSTRSSKVSRKLVREKGKSRQIQRAAVTAWSTYLDPERDYNATLWRMRVRHHPENVFDSYAGLLSDVFKKEGATVNFALVGACDGTNDITIADRFLPNDHWNALFVEPMTLNYRDLKKFLVKNNVADRSHTIQAAVTNDCPSPTILVKLPKGKGEDEDEKQPHWLRRQIGGIAAINPKTGKPDMPSTWKTEEVKCVSGDDLLRTWASATTAGPENRALKSAQKKRPHVLKIDAEGHDYQVLASFLTKETKNHELPLLITFEAKMLKDNYPLARALLESRGYVVTKYAADAFALLRAEYFSNVKAARKKVESE